jgi:hypothetical protein
VFGWKADALQKIMDEACYVSCNSMKTQSMDAMNKCSLSPVVKEDIDGCMSFMPIARNLPLGFKLTLSRAHRASGTPDNALEVG